MWDTFVLLDRDLVRMTFVIGVAVSVLLYERTHLTTGSIVVPGYIGAELLNPESLLITAFNAIATYLVVSKLIPKLTVVYGRARFVLNIVVSITIALSLTAIFNSITPGSAAGFETIGYVIPALIAYDMNRQGARKTLGVVLVSGVLAVIPAMIVVSINPGIVDPPLPFNPGLLEVGEFWLPFAVLISVGVGTLLQAGHRLRCGGFIGAIYLGLTAVEPWQPFYLMALGLITYGLVTYGLKPIMILFGRRKFATMMLVGAMLSWVSLEVAGMFSPSGLNLGHMPIAVVAVPALLANDMERSSVVEVLTGSLLGAVATLSTLLVVSRTIDEVPIPWWAPASFAVSGMVLLWPWLSPGLALPKPTPAPSPG